MEDHLTRSKGRETEWLFFDRTPTPLVLRMSEFYARRMMAGDLENGPLVAGRLVNMLPEKDKPAALRGIAKALEGRTLKVVPDDLLDPLGALVQIPPASCDRRAGEAGDRGCAQAEIRTNLIQRPFFRNLTI